MLKRFFRSRQPSSTESRRTPKAGHPPSPVEIVLAYHQITKHHYQRQARSLGYLDWDSQPDPFRRFAGADRVRLPFIEEDFTPPFSALFDGSPIAPRRPDLGSVAALFELSLGVTAWKELSGSRWSLRANPSSGNLHPTEGYVVIGPEPGGGGGLGLEDSAWVCHYAPAEHAFEVRARFAAASWHQLMAGFPAGSFLVGLTSIHWREAWKYGERAYRYCHHDTGHAWAAIRLAAASAGWRVVLLEALADAEAARLLGTDRLDEFPESEREEAEGLAVVVPSSEPGVVVPAEIPPHSLDQLVGLRWSGRANTLSPEHVEWEVIERTASAAAKPRTAAPPRVLGAPSRGAALEGGAASGPSARELIVKRRSAVDLDGKTRLSADTFHRMLARVLPTPDGGGWMPPPWDAIGWEPRIHLGLFVHRVDDVPPGFYALPRRVSAIETIRAAMRPEFRWEHPESAPAALPLFLLRELDCRSIASSVSCGQSIAGDGVFSVAMLGELEDTIREVGPWAYRQLHWEAGMIGQMLYLEAEAAGIRGTGIGCFFDDPVHDVFGLRGTRFHTLYHFTLGGPIEDRRLTTLPPYSPERRSLAVGLVSADP